MLSSMIRTSNKKGKMIDRDVASLFKSLLVLRFYMRALSDAVKRFKSFCIDLSARCSAGFSFMRYIYLWTRGDGCLSTGIP